MWFCTTSRPSKNNFFELVNNLIQQSRNLALAAPDGRCHAYQSLNANMRARKACNFEHLLRRGYFRIQNCGERALFQNGKLRPFDVTEILAFAAC
jgi:hypothetical protein